MNKSTAWLNFLERVTWTLLQVATASGITQVIHEITGNAVSPVWTIVIATCLAAVKNAAAQAFGSPTGATLPADKAPVLAEDAGDVVYAGRHGK